MKRWLVLVGCCVWILLLTSTVCEAGIRGPGQYSGVVVFDRWDGCTLYSGVYVMYVAEKAKQSLRKHAGRAIQIDATEVYQPVNPGDGRIKKFRYLGPAPEDRAAVRLRRLYLKSSVEVRQDGKPIGVITIQNKGRKPIELFSQELAPTILVKKRGSSAKFWSVSDGPSFALITRVSFEVGGSDPRWEGEGVKGFERYAWTIGKENALPHKLTLGPGQEKLVRLHFDLPNGEYDFIAGYGGGVHDGRCIASNLSAFDVRNGKAKIIKIESRSRQSDR